MMQLDLISAEDIPHEKGGSIEPPPGEGGMTPPTKP
jgi:hypothetical protein